MRRTRRVEGISRCNDDQTHDPDGPDIARSDDTAHEQLIADRRAPLAQVPDGLPADTGQAPAQQGSVFTTTPTYLAPVLENLEHQLAQAAADLHMEASEVSPLGPWVTVGTIDGRAFCLHERGEQYTIVIAADDTPTLNPWTSEPAGTITVKTGTGADLTDPAGNDYEKALNVIATAVRSYLRQTSCPHPHATATDRYCAACGLPLIDPAQPTQPPAAGARPPQTTPLATPPTTRTRHPPDAKESRP